MSYLLRVFSSLALVALLIGCGSTRPILNTKYQGQDAGKVFASISNDRTAYSYVSILIRPYMPEGSREKTPAASLGYSVGFSKKPHFHIGYEHGEVAIATLSAGEYEIFGYEMVQGGLVEVIASSRSLTPFRFTVNAREAVYLGAYRASVRDNSFGLPSPFLPKIWVRDQIDRDLPIAMQNDPSITQTLRRSVPAASVFGSTVFVDVPN